ncbi:hypothetical protein BB341_15815 [Streptomyces clavuligerus]|uniref:Uncharacterized protein n=1 Tax=Streptomyces clavuligerus TaxID=1901 RepID=B5GPN8_STRCL|nr:hypothetical protein BB341_15815 [Streptomyces clavuligerus]AXU14185.1 hypothetical protein D1794_16495 [Streptomyces clavuligerus]EDY48284.1 hypothetical protein SSCG_01565 [Streptomyces clavuligerus]EFG07606.1 Hypothetical protein SCLAV_2534 [Streptomyces clavuligerus]QCS06958.1 hypothetical protein CRV15_15850 [Streptomyces clavuligerus]
MVRPPSVGGLDGPGPASTGEVPVRRPDRCSFTGGLSGVPDGVFSATSWVPALALGAFRQVMTVVREVLGGGRGQPPVVPRTRRVRAADRRPVRMFGELREEHRGPDRLGG